MSIRAKRRRTNNKHPQTEDKDKTNSNDLRFNDDEPIGVSIDWEDDESDQDSSPSASSNAPLPSRTIGKDSTKPTVFDKLPWKTIALPDFISDGLTFDTDGGLLGLEELDGSVWEEHLKKSKNPKRSFDQTDQDPLDDHQDSNQTKAIDHQHQSQPASSDLFGTQTKIDKDLRKKAKKERLAELRRLKQASKPNSTDTKTPPANQQSPESDEDEDLEDVDWAAAAELDAELPDMGSDENIQLIMRSFDESLLPSWSHLKLASPIRRALYNLAFTKPTPVQQASIPISLSSSNPPRDLVVIAETGSGKTLAYAIPILNDLILSNPSSLSESNSQVLPIASLILTPTRELCLQVKAHIDTFLKAMCADTPSPGNQAELPPNRTGITTVAICGGIAIAKQRKQLERSQKLMEPGKGGLGCVVVATPGRLWDLIQSWNEFAEGIKRNLDWLILDEADRMIEKGHFEEIEKILKLTKRFAPTALRNDDEVMMTKEQTEEAGEDELKGSEIGQNFVKENIRTMIFSATMDKNLQINLKKKNFRRMSAVGALTQPADPMHDLLERIDFRDPQPEFIDLTPAGKLVGGLKECKIECLLKDKDLYLFHFLLRYTGRTIVFLSSISALRRLSPIFTLLLPNSTVLTLHSEMQQRSRLKSLDKFRSTSNSILLSTDVAARGLDIPQVNHVIHYQIPRTVDCYIHRSGRTARAGNGGVALALIAPDELKPWRSLMKSLGRADDLSSPPIEYSISNKLKEMLELAKKIDTLEHQSTKLSHEKNWTKTTAEMLEIDLDKDDSDEEHKSSRPKRENKATMQAKVLRAELENKLGDPLIIKNNSLVIRPKNHHRQQLRPKKINNCFIKDPQIIERFLSNQSHSKLIGLQSSVNALSELS